MIKQGYTGTELDVKNCRIYTLSGHISEYFTLSQNGTCERHVFRHNFVLVCDRFETMTPLDSQITALSITWICFPCYIAQKIANILNCDSFTYVSKIPVFGQISE